MIPCVKKFSSIIPLNFRAHSNVNIMGYNSFRDDHWAYPRLATWPYCFRNNWTLLCYLFQSIRCFAMTFLYSGDHSLFVTCGRRGWEDFGTFRQWRVGGGRSQSLLTEYKGRTIENWITMRGRGEEGRGIIRIVLSLRGGKVIILWDSQHPLNTTPPLPLRR